MKELIIIQSDENFPSQRIREWFHQAEIPSWGAYPIVTARSKTQLQEVIGFLDPRIVVLFSQTLSGLIFEHPEADFHHIEGQIREMDYLGKKRLILALPGVLELDEFHINYIERLRRLIDA